VFKSFIPEVEFLDFVNINHNYAALEHHYSKDVIVHRKGATSAKEGEIGLIPGSQGTKSYMVKGLGNPLSFRSCSHGAGRKMSRKAAKQSLDLETEKMKMGNTLHSINAISDLDEAPGAYKDINTVMENQKDLVEVIVEFTPLLVIKG
jgi:tRNA-splicing ligase RtcB